MISVSGIKYQKELETLPYFNKKTAALLIGKKGKNLDKKIEQLKRKKYLLSLKKGTYVSSLFVEKLTDKKLYLEHLANVLRYPSYISLEYALSECGLVPEGVATITSVSLKSGRVFENSLASFVYKNVKAELFSGFVQKSFLDKKINFASPAKALFDFLYLKKLSNPKQELKEDLRINWTNFAQADFKEFSQYVKKSQSLKMSKILRIIEEIYDRQKSWTTSQTR